jgi:hypothetical protein
MGLKGYRLWVMGQMNSINSTCTAPPLAHHEVQRARHVAAHHGVALQVAFERQTLTPVFSLDRF